MYSFCQRRFLCSKIANKWRVKQVTKSNFQESLKSFTAHLSESDFVAISLQKTGSFLAPWHKVLPFDTPDIAYCKTKQSAERFQILQFAVCPFSIKGPHKAVAYPYNFHLFPRDELKVGMPSYSFSCQTSYLTSMANEGFDFNACIYDGLSYISRAQESVVKKRIGSPIPSQHTPKSLSTTTVADSVFMERIRSRIKHWRNTCKSSFKMSNTNEVLLESFRKILLGSDEFGSRPSMTIDICSSRQLQLVLEIMAEFSDDLVPLLVPGKGGSTQAVRVVLTSSKDDKDLFERELRKLEEEQDKKIRGFREVIELISASKKPVVSHNSLNDFTSIHSKFIAPLPPRVDEFLCDLHMVFPHVLDVRHLFKEIKPLRNLTNVPAAISYLKNHYFSPIDIKIPHEAMAKEGDIHGQNSLRICQLFVKLCSLLKISTNIHSGNIHLDPAFESITSIFSPYSINLEDPDDIDVNVWVSGTRKVSAEHLIFLWGFGGEITAGILKSLLQGSHEVFSSEFDVKLVNQNCAVVVFWEPGVSEAFLQVINSAEIKGVLKEMVSDGLRATAYKTYKRTFELNLWERDLVESLENSMDEIDPHVKADSGRNTSDIYWHNDDIINLDDL